MVMDYNLFKGQLNFMIILSKPRYFFLHISKMSRENGYGSSNEGEHESIHAGDGHP